MLNNSDYKIILSIIEAGAKNGLFRPSDFFIVGELYNKLQTQLTQESEKQ